MSKRVLQPIRLLVLAGLSCLAIQTSLASNLHFQPRNIKACFAPRSASPAKQELVARLGSPPGARKQARHPAERLCGGRFGYAWAVAWCAAI